MNIVPEKGKDIMKVRPRMEAELWKGNKRRFWAASSSVDHEDDGPS